MATAQQIQDVMKQMQDNSTKWHSSDASAQKQLSDANLQLGTSIGAKRNDAAGTWDYSGVRADPEQKQMPAMPDYSSQINAIYDQQKAARLAELRGARDKAVGDVNLQKQQTAPAYYAKRNDADATMAQNVQRLRESMASAGLTSTGENVTAQVGQNAARQNVLGNLNQQEQQTMDDFNKRITDLNNPQQEQAMISAIEADRARALYQAQQDAIHNSMSEAGLTGLYNGQQTMAARGQQFDQGIQQGQLTGNYIDPRAQALAQQIYGLKNQNATGGNTALQANADQLRAQLSSMGYDANALFGADVTAQQALSNISQLRQRTMPGQQFDYQKGIDTRNFNYQVGRDNVGDTRYNNEFAYKQQRDSVGDSQWGSEFGLRQQGQTFDQGYKSANLALDQERVKQDADYKGYLKSKDITETQGVKATNGYISQALGKGSRDEAINYINQNADHIVNDGGNITQILTALNQKWASPNTSYDPYGLGK